jgi:ribosome assembly protein RRB1
MFMERGGKLMAEFHPAPEDEDEEVGEKELETYLAGMKLEEGEQLVPDNSVYLALHSLSYAWPCLSFDILRDNLGEDRSTYPHTSWLVTGTQAGEIPGQGKAKDEVVIMRMSGLSKTQYDDDSEAGDDDDELDFQTIPHVGNVNRIRAAPVPASSAIPDPYHVATFSETGKVHIFDVKPYIDTLSGPSRPRQKLPAHTITNHGRSEGFAVEWGNTGLLTGDVEKKIFLTTHIYRILPRLKISNGPLTRVQSLHHAPPTGPSGYGISGQKEGRAWFQSRRTTRMLMLSAGTRALTTC